MKRGRMSNVETDYVKSNGNQKSYVEIAEDLNRDPESIKQLLLKLGFKVDLSTKSFNPVYVSRLKDKPFYSTLQSQFDDEELVFFENEWNQIHEQFKGDVLPTEELQIVDSIKISILLNRNLVMQKRAKIEMRGLEQELEDELKLSEEHRNEPKLDNLRQQISFIMAGQSSLGKDLKELLARKSAMFEELKATRKARISKIESSRESYLAWMGELIANPDRRRDIGLMMEKMRLATITEKVRLAAYHKYEDGEVDQPLLTPETVKDDNINV